MGRRATQSLPSRSAVTISLLNEMATVSGVPVMTTRSGTSA
jgi:hypothetical protein